MSGTSELREMQMSTARLEVRARERASLLEASTVGAEQSVAATVEVSPSVPVDAEVSNGIGENFGGRVIETLYRIVSR